MQRLSVTIITYNEERNIARAIKSVAFADEVIVIDSKSTDKTVEIAQSLGAKVIEHPFSGYGQQKNYAMSLANGDWILNIDGDEEVTPKLAESIKKILEKGSTSSLYKIGRRNFYCGKWIRYGGWYPDKKVRLCKRESAKWSEPHVHEHLVSTIDEPTSSIDGDLNHYSFTTVRSQVRTNLKYASLGGNALQKKGARTPLIKIILKPCGKFIECYFLKLGVLDGLFGFVIAINAAHSIFLKYVFAYLGENDD